MKITTYLFSLLVLFIVFTLDRIILVLFFHLESKSFNNWIDSNDKKLSFIRVLILYPIALIIYLLNK